MGIFDAKRKFDPAGQRYQVIDGSQNCHCCFEYTIVDTTRPVMIGGKQYDGQFEPVCETFELGDADLICSALNAWGKP